MAKKVKWQMKGDTISACNCDYGCPCNFNAPPTYGNCQGLYAFHINEGNFEETRLDGVTIGVVADAPEAIHKGNLTMYVAVDQKANPKQREALGTILGGKVGGPFQVFAGLTTKLIGPEFVPVTWKFDGPNSEVSFGNRIDAKLDSIKNPVTGKPSGYTLQFAAGLLTDRSELMSTRAFSVNHPELSFSHPGKYGQTFKFSYSGEGEV